MVEVLGSDGSTAGISLDFRRPSSSLGAAASISMKPFQKPKKQKGLTRELTGSGPVALHLTGNTGSRCEMMSDEVLVCLEI
jgi:hypothetical protein